MCEFCGNEKDIVFPFQLHKCQRCEGEHAPLGAGLGGPRSPFPRPSVSLTWRDWKISKPRRLSNILSRDMREGEGGEEAAEKEKSRGPFQASAHGRKGDEEEEEEEEAESEQEGEKKPQKGGGGHHRRLYRKLGGMLGDGRGRRQVNLLKTLHIDRLKKSVGRGSSDGESMESQEETAPERKHLWNVPKLTVFSKGFPRRDGEAGGKRGEKEDKEGREGQEEEESRRFAGDREASEKRDMERSSTERLHVLKMLRGQKVTGRTEEEEEEEDTSRENGGERESGATVVTRKTWRGRNPRRARRLTRGRKVEDPTERGSKPGGEGSTDREAGGSGSGGEEYEREQVEVKGGSQDELDQRIQTSPEVF